MTSIKISELPLISAPNFADVMPVVQSNTTYKITLNQISELFSDESFTVRLASTANLNATYNNGASGVGATLINAGALAALQIDGQAVNGDDLILIKDQSTQSQNGIYKVTNVGSPSVAWVLTRASNYDEANEIDQSDFFTVQQGTVNSKTQWIQTQIVSTIGTDNIIFESNIIAGTGLTKTNNTISLTVPVTMSNGGTGKSLTADNGGIVYCDADSFEILASTITANQVLLSGSSAAPKWSLATFAGSYAASSLLFSSGANNVTGLATANSSALRTDATGVPSWSASLTDGQLLIGATGATPNPGNITSTSGLVVTNGANTIGLDLPTGTEGQILITDGSTYSPRSYQIGKNIIIGGDFATNPWQRGTTLVAPTDNSYLADRFSIRVSGTGVSTVSRVSDSPAVAEADQFSFYCLDNTVTTADVSIGAGDFYAITQKIEGHNFTRIAQRPFTLSFWVKSSITGIFTVGFINAGLNRSFVAEYTINASDTWEKKIINVDATPSGGTWNYENGIGINVLFNMAVGSTYQTTPGTWQTGTFFSTANQVNGYGTVGNSFRLNLIQIESGDYATQFETRLITEVLADCQRYYAKTFPLATAPASAAGVDNAITYSVTNAGVSSKTMIWDLPVRMRSTPSITFYNPTGAGTNWYNTTAGANSGASSTNNVSTKIVSIVNPQVAADAVGDVIKIHATASAEL